MKSKHEKIIILSLSLTLLFILSFIIGFKLKEKDNIEKQNLAYNNDQNLTENENTNDKDIDEKALPVLSVPDRNEITLSSVGDCTIGSDNKFSYDGSLVQVFNNNNNDYSYFLKNVVDIFKNDDITIANLETTFTTATIKADKEFTFKAPPEYAKVLASGSIEGVNIANNHIRDYLEKGLTDTKNSLKAEKVNYFGEGEKWITDIKGVKFGFLGYLGFSYDKTYLAKIKKDIQELKSQGCIVIINFHWGDEGLNQPNNTQKYLAHYSIDNGADLIIGHHPHVIQGIERYKDKLICYSLGNFCFGGNKNPGDKDTFILQNKFKFEDKKLVSYGVRVIPCSISSVSYKNDYSPTPMTSSKKVELLNRLNKYSLNLNFKISDNFYYIDVNN